MTAVEPAPTGADGAGALRGGSGAAVGPDAARPEFDAGRVVRAGGSLGAFNEARVLAPADVHVATTLGRLGGETDDAALLAAALAVRAPRLGHVHVDLAGVRDTVTVDEDAPVDLDALPWPEPGAWVEAVAASRLATAAGGGPDRPLRLAGTRLYLDRYWRYEQRVLDHLRARCRSAPAEVDAARLREGLDRLFPRDPEGERPDRQRLAAAAAVLRSLTVIAGGPGTGKTTTVAKLLALLGEQRPGERLRVALAAPTGKAADRVGQAVREGAAGLDVDPVTRDWLRSLEASTIHRLLGRRPGGDTRFRHDRGNPLPLDVVVVDETSMVALSLIAKLLDAVAPQTRLVLLGDPEQLASVEAGAVLGDIVGPTSTGLRMTAGGRRELADHSGEPVPADDPPAGVSIGDAIVVLRRIHRFAADSGIAALARAIQSGDGEAVSGLLTEPRDDLAWVAVPGDEEGRSGAAMASVRDAVVEAGARVFDAAREGERAQALAALGEVRVLCAHRRGPFGVSRWVPAIEGWLAGRLDGFETAGPWYLGQPILITENDYQLNLFNGDVGVVVAGDHGRPMVALPDPAGVRMVNPVRLEAYETVHAMTVHKSQGSQFGHVVVVLPEASSPILTRELLYTAVTRAQDRLTIVGTEDAVRAAVDRRIQRASGLRDALWAVSPEKAKRDQQA